MTHQKPCKFCKRQLEVESNPDCTEEWVAVFLEFLACNRCADYHSRMGSRTRNIRKVCLNYIQLHNSKELTDEIIDNTRRMLSALTKSVAETVCRFYGSPVVWEPDFVQQLIDKPEKAEAIISTYARMVRQSRQRESTHDTK